MKNPYQNIRIEYHILQSFPVTCLNRDDVGAPKTANVGGVTRARVSSQCWKREVRQALHTLEVPLATRTKKVADYLARACQDHGADSEQAQQCGDTIASFLTDDTLLFISNSEALAFAEYAANKSFEVEQLHKNDVHQIAKKNLNPNIDALDIALFGRMVAKAPTLNVEAAASFSHAISTHKVHNEVEFFTALDDLQEEPGSAHMGALEFNAATYYRYISLDLGQLAETLGIEDLNQAIEAFTKALFIAIPQARQTTQSGASPWEFARVLIRKGQRLQVPFETPVKAQNGGFIQPSIEALKNYIDQKETMTGSLFGKIASHDWGEEKDYSIDHLIDDLKKATTEQVNQNG